MNEYILEAGLGESIQSVAEEAIRIGRELRLQVKFTFNGTDNIVNPYKDTVEGIVEGFHTQLKESQAAYEKTDEYKEQRIKQERDLVETQQFLDETLIQWYSDIDYNSSLSAMIPLLKKFTELAARVGVSYDKERFVEFLNYLGFTKGDYVGYEGEWTAEILMAWGVGQMIDGIESVGCPHPITIKSLTEVEDKLTQGD